MAKLSRDDVLKLARLARLELSDEEIAKFQSEISDILGYVEQLQNADISGLEPTFQVTGLKDVTRPDEVCEYQASPDDLLKGVPTKEGRHIKVKRVLE